ncbi:MAG: DUF952 domain-containing protein [Alphaproteobacteria bacterium]
MADFIYHLCRAGDWHDGRTRGAYGAALLRTGSGFLHFSTAATVRDSARLHCASWPDLVLLKVATAPLGAALRWEPSRDGRLFPHLYRTLDPAHVVRWWTLRDGLGRTDHFPDEID